MPHRLPLSERFKIPGYIPTEQDLKELESIEKTVNAKYVHAGSNGVVKRWWDIIRNVGAIAGVIWFLSSEWSGTKRDIADAGTKLDVVSSQVSRLTADVTTMQLQLYGLQVRDAARDQVPGTPTIRPSRPAFSRTEQFAPEVEE